MSIEKEKLVKRTPVFEGRLLHIYNDDVEIGGNMSWREVVLHPGASAVIPVTKEGNILFVRQYRYAVEHVLLEIPAGKLDAGEDPDVCAERELTEETGCIAGKMTKLGAIYTTPGFCNETIHIYLAEELTKGEQHLDDDEFLDVVRVPVSKAYEMIARGEIRDAKTLAAFAMAGDRLKR